MIKLIQSSKLKIPVVYLVETLKDLQELPLGIPFIRGGIKDYDKCVQMLEWEVLWKSAIELGLPFNWEKILRKAGYSTYKYGIAYSDGGDWFAEGDLSGEAFNAKYESEGITCSEFLKDTSYKVDIELLKDLKLLPSWLENVEESIKENITDTILYNSSLYTKKLGLPLGSFEYSPSTKNVIIIDISGSIPSGVSSTILVLAKTLAEKFYADILITGSKSTLYDYTQIDQLDINIIYEENGKDNDQVWFKELLEQPKKYKTAIVFGDNHQPGQTWKNGFNKNTKTISRSQGQELCRWEIEDIISFHTASKTDLAGYALWFNTSKITFIDNWVSDLNLQ